MTAPKMAMSADFLAAYAKLPGQQQRAVRTMISRFESDSRGSGLNYEKIGNAKDANMRSLRIDGAYRAIVLKPTRAMSTCSCGPTSTMSIRLGYPPRLLHQRGDRGAAGLSAPSCGGRWRRRPDFKRVFDGRARRFRGTQASRIGAPWGSRGHGSRSSRHSVRRVAR